ncbi:hypothetical protein ACIBO2_42240 [Nonomuraea sp. NPDC050022]|uniref:hypothetical protein n=1 Tax=Nonomuraea sp. NPDC050022 TaxID=3364358 RepID=UPI0037A1DE20
MPSPAHDTLNALFRNRPAFAVEILRDVFDVDLPPDVLIEVAGNDFNDRPSLDFQADTVITVGPRQDPIFGVIVEIQQDTKEHKRTAWARYAAALWLQLKCPVVVLALCPDTRVATWAAEPIVTSLPGFVLQPQAFGPDQVPAITDHVQAADCLELAAMSVMMHGQQRTVTEAYMTALNKLPDGDSLQYYEYAYRLASLATRRIMEEIMSLDLWPLQSPILRGLVSKGEATALIKILKARAISVPQDAHDRIAECKDPDQMEEWIVRAASAASIDDVFR